jgi:DNA polymerase III epsilon subunit family exonuclease
MTDPRQHIDETDFVVVDVETTGLSADRGDRVCEVAAVKLRGGAVVESFGSLIDPCRPISPGAYAVNRISQQMLADAPRFDEIAEQLGDLIKHSVIVAYNAPFDVSFLNSEFRLAGFPAMKNNVVDALAIARQVLPGLGRYPQENVARVVGIPFPVKHRALEDVMITAKLFTLFTTILKAHDMVMLNDLAANNMAKRLEQKRLRIVEASLEQGVNVWLKYLSASDAEITDRVVTPKELAGRNAAVSLLAYCHSSRMEKSFRIDRILDIRLLPQRVV